MLTIPCCHCSTLNITKKKRTQKTAKVSISKTLSKANEKKTTTTTNKLNSRWQLKGKISIELWQQGNMEMLKLQADKQPNYGGCLSNYKLNVVVDLDFFTLGWFHW